MREPTYVVQETLEQKISRRTVEVLAEFARLYNTIPVLSPDNIRNIIGMNITSKPGKLAVVIRLSEVAQKLR